MLIELINNLIKLIYDLIESVHDIMDKNKRIAHLVWGKSYDGLRLGDCFNLGERIFCILVDHDDFVA